MATTTTPDLSAVSVPVIRQGILDEYHEDPGIIALAEQDNTLKGRRVGDQVKIGTWGAVTAAQNLGEIDEIVPEKLTATALTFTAGRVGKAYSYSYMSNLFTAEDLQAKASAFLGQAAKMRVAMNLWGAMVTSATATGRVTTAVGADLTAAEVIGAVRTFPKGMRRELRIVAHEDLVGALSAEIMAGGQQFAGQTVWADGEIDRIYGAKIVDEGTEYLPGDVAGAILLPGKTLVSAFALDPLIEIERFPKRASIDVTMNTVWAGGVQQPKRLRLLK